MLCTVVCVGITLSQYLWFFHFWSFHCWEQTSPTLLSLSLHCHRSYQVACYRTEDKLHQTLWFSWFIGCLAGGFVHLFIPSLPPPISDLEITLRKTLKFATMGVGFLSSYEEEKKKKKAVYIYSIPRLLKLKTLIFKEFLFNGVIVTSVNQTRNLPSSCFFLNYRIYIMYALCHVSFVHNLLYYSFPEK